MQSSENEPVFMGRKSLEKILVKLAEHIQHLWVNAYKNWQIRKGEAPTYRSSVRYDGGYDRKTDKHYPCVWVKIACFVLQNNIEPESLVAAQFDHEMMSPFPRPTDMMTDKGVARYRSRRYKVVTKFEQHLQAQKVAARLAVASASALYSNPDDAYAFVLASPEVEITPLFRYCLASERGLEKSAKFWIKQAIFQYSSEPKIYDRVWGDLIPEEIKMYSRALQQSINTVNVEGVGLGHKVSYVPEEAIWE